MNFESTFVRQRWLHERRYMIDWLLIALLAIVFTPWPVAEAMPFVIAIFASGLGISIGGYATRTGSWEFLMTRGFSRERFVRATFVAVLLPVAAFAVLGFIADAIDIDRRIHALFVPGAMTASANFAVENHFGGLLFGLLIGANATLLALRSHRSEALPGLRVASFVYSALMGGVIVLVLGIPRSIEVAPGAVLAPPSVVTVLIVVFALALVVIQFRIGLSSVKRHEVLGAGEGAGESSAAGCLVGLLILLALAFFAFLLARPLRVAAVPDSIPAGPSQTAVPQGK